MGIEVYHPDIRIPKPEGIEIDLSISHYGGNLLRTKLVLKGRGITLTGVNAETQIRSYKVTDLALKKIEAQYRVGFASYLD